MFRVSAADRAGHETVVSRKVLVSNDLSSEVVLWNPMPGDIHSGPLTVSGKVSGAVIPDRITLYINNRSSVFADVDRFGMFRHQYPADQLPRDGALVISAGYENASGERIMSREHSVRYIPYGPSLTVESHRDGDVITGRPWLSGRAWISEPEPSGEPVGESPGQPVGLPVVQKVQVSFDNGRSFHKAQGKENWKIRLETAGMPPGALPVLVKADFAGGETAVHRLLLTVDTAAPRIETMEPAEDSTHRDKLLVYGSAADDFELDSVEISFRPGDKAAYSVPRFIQGLYLDTHFMGATWVDLGVGLSFFDDNVKLQLQAGFAPSVDSRTGTAGRFIGTVFGTKLLANVLYVPFEYFFGPDWSFFSMSAALGANFSYFTMDPDNGRPPLYMGAVLAQWEFARVAMSHFFPRWKYCKTLSLYMEPVLWFASSDVKAGPIFRMTLGTRVTFF
jgi:hypothetical protein